MTVSNWLKKSVEALGTADIGTARLDCLVLLEDETKKDRAWLLAHLEQELSYNQTVRLNKKITRRANHEPLAYIRGHSEFYGRSFKVNRHVLEPRPESETMIEMLKELVKTGEFRVKKKGQFQPSTSHSSLLIADVGTGCGALGITAALELHNHRVDLFDIDAGAVAVAKHNTQLHELSLHVRKSNLLSRHLAAYDVVLANLPYVPNDWKVNPAALREPKLAIFGGVDGLDVYRRLFQQLAHFATWPKYVLTEAMPPQQTKLAQIAAQNGYKLRKSQDFIQLFSY